MSLLVLDGDESFLIQRHGGCVPYVVVGGGPGQVDRLFGLDWRSTGGG